MEDEDYDCIQLSKPDENSVKPHENSISAMKTVK